MKTVLKLVAALSVICGVAFAQSAPNWYFGKIPTAAEIAAVFASKQDVLGFAPVNSANVGSTIDFLAGTTGKILTAGTVFTAETTTPFGATVTLNASTFINTKVTLTGNVTTMTCSNFKAGQGGMVTMIQDSTGSRTTVWCSTFKFAGGTPPALSTTPNSVDVLAYSCRSATFCVGNLLKAVN